MTLHWTLRNRCIHRAAVTIVAAVAAAAAVIQSTRLLISTVFSKMEDFSRSQAVTYTAG